MSLTQARHALAALRPDRPAIVRTARKPFAWVAYDADGGYYCLATGGYYLPDDRDSAEWFAV